jgi:hypothetical protein
MKITNPISDHSIVLRTTIAFLGFILLAWMTSGCTTGQIAIPIQTQAVASRAAPTEMASASPIPARTEAVSSSAGEIPQFEPDTETAQPTATTPVNQTPVNTAGPPTARPTLSQDAWMTAPVIPTVSDTTRQIYQRGLEMGNDPHAFSKIGDCQNVESYFLSPFAYPDYYDLAQYSYLQETINWFTDSFTRESLAVKGGFNVAAVLSPMRSDPDACNKDETPLACEIRLHRPSIAIISMETWWSGSPDNYEKYMRQLLDYTIAQGVVPILATKADNLEGDNQINKVLVRLAWDYDIPLWNFWLAVQPLPDHGLTSDGFHLTLGNYFYNDPEKSQTGWSMRNLTALQALDAVWRGVNGQPIPTPTNP